MDLHQSTPFARVFNDEGETLLFAGQNFYLGRSSENAIVITDPKVSRTHAVLEWNGTGFTLRDLGSINGTFVNSQRLADTARLLRDGDEIQLSQHKLSFEIIRAEPSEPLVGEGPRADEPPLTALGPRLLVSAGPDMGQEFPLWGEMITIGRASRDATWEIRLSDRSVSRPHARLELRDGCFYLLDLESANGTKLNSDAVMGATLLKDGDVIGVGATSLIFQL